MRKFNYPQELLEQVEFIAGKDSELYRACEQGADIGELIYGWGDEFTFSNDEILNVRGKKDLLELRKRAKINLAKNEVYELYLDSFRQEVLNYQSDSGKSDRSKLKAEHKQDSLIGRRVAPTATQEESDAACPSSYKDDVNESLAPTKSEIRKAFEGLLDVNDIEDDDDASIEHLKPYLNEDIEDINDEDIDDEVKRKVEDFEPYMKAGLDS